MPLTIAAYDAAKKIGALAQAIFMNGHTDSVSAVAWESVDVVWSGGFDHALKSWDVETGKHTQSYDVPKAIMGMACVAGGGRVAWCGGGDKAVHMWDPRVGATTGATTSLMSHTVRIYRPARFASFEFGFFFLLVPFVLVVFEARFGAAAGVGDETTFVSRVGDDVGDKTITLIFS